MRLARSVLLGLVLLLIASCSRSTDAAHEGYRDARALVADYLTLRRDARFKFIVSEKSPYWIFEADAEHADLAKRVFAAFHGDYAPRDFGAFMIEAALHPIRKFEIDEEELPNGGTLFTRVLEPPDLSVLASLQLGDAAWDRFRMDEAFCPSPQAREKHRQRLIEQSRKVAARWTELYPAVWIIAAKSATRSFEITRREDGSFVLEYEMGGADNDLPPVPTDTETVLKHMKPDEFECYGPAPKEIYVPEGM